MEVESVFVTGGNRGIGLEFVRQFVQLPNPPRFVFATYRHSNAVQELEAIKNASKKTQVVPIKMDVSKIDEVQKARTVVADAVGDSGLTLLINNAGVCKIQGFPDITEESLMFHFITNTVGPVSVAKELHPLLQKAAARKASGLNVSRAAVVNISAQLGSISELDENQKMLQFTLNAMAYRISKAALHMAMRVIALTVKDDGILIVNICPGWVKTDMGSERAALEVSDSISAMMNTLSKLDDSHHGTCMDRNGNNFPF